MTEYPYQKAQREAAEKLSSLLAKPMPETENDIGDVDMFDPWDLLPVYGNYSGEFDQCAIQVLQELISGKADRHDLGAHMFREMLCVAELCEYGTSPRVCFPTYYSRLLFPDLLDKWRRYSILHWNVDVTKED